MSTRLQVLRKRFFEAKADVGSSNREMRRASARKLERLKSKGDSKALVAGLKDPALTSYDRERLEQMITDLLPRRRVRLPRSLTNWAFSLLRNVRYAWRGLLLLGVMLLPFAVIGSIALMNTGRMIGTFNNDYNISSKFPDGHTEVIPVRVGAAVIVTGRLSNGDYRLRFWTTDYGYGYATISSALLNQIVKY
ncbi:hypothetical protein [Rhodopseudomonas palustris]|uniref:hypothetical protein n=1 Tax=Rhodopseudomonas palustris TaxID=1076 RepID=UPI0021F30CCF|nr:hypothetical protein [Rhodopseudomonas palustris]UYO54614.1 hypothetical protein KQX61_04100 [Rhodopseudomonas palustris]